MKITGNDFQRSQSQSVYGSLLWICSCLLSQPDGPKETGQCTDTETEWCVWIQLIRCVKPSQFLFYTFQSPQNCREYISTDNKSVNKQEHPASLCVASLMPFNTASSRQRLELQRLKNCVTSARLFSAQLVRMAAAIYSTSDTNSLN